MHSAVGRGDDARLVKICHMCVPTHLTCIGPLPYYFMAVVLLGGKTMKVRSWGSRIWVALAKQLPRPAAPPPPSPLDLLDALLVALPDALLDALPDALLDALLAAR